MAKKKSGAGHGGRREGAGRRPVTGEMRPHRYVIHLTDTEAATLASWAEHEGKAAGEVCREIVMRALARRAKRSVSQEARR